MFDARKRARAALKGFAGCAEIAARERKKRDGEDSEARRHSLEWLGCMQAWHPDSQVLTSSEIITSRACNLFDLPGRNRLEE